MIPTKYTQTIFPEDIHKKYLASGTKYIQHIAGNFTEQWRAKFSLDMGKQTEQEAGLPLTSNADYNSSLLISLHLRLSTLSWKL